ncbi:MAG: DnaD domain protein [Clostridia bacterium]|nr:DnaD domain protein [Clostridia bacterium]
MNFKINPLSFNGIFAVPNSLVDENIRLASVVQLKSLLYLLRYGNLRTVTTEEMAEALCLDKADVQDAMVFWLERGLVLKENEEPSLTTRVTIEKAPHSAAKPAAEPERVLPEIVISKPSHEEVSARLKGSEELSLFFQQAQASLGKPFGYEGQSTLLMLHDGYGLPLEIIIMAIEYCVSQKKDGFRHIVSLAKRWSELNIDTIEGVNQYLEEHTIVDEAWEKLRSMTEITNRHPTEKQRRFMTSWTKELAFTVEMIYYAYEESIDRTGKMNMKYMDTIIRNWASLGIRTPADIKKHQDEWEKKKNAGKAPAAKKESKKEDNEPSYDIGLFMKEAVNLKYKKQENN